MNKPTRILAALALTAFAGTAWAQEEERLKVTANDVEGVMVSESDLTLDSKLKFTSDCVEVYNGESLTASFPYAEIGNLKFSYYTLTGLKDVTSSDVLRLRNNPVEETLAFIGFNGTPAPLMVTDLGGASRVAIPEWKGEGIDVSNLTPGLYFVTVDKTTFKFIKK